ncbi:hypothetical protein HJFPF1_10241 [Paramyrothecium foliicola]|nr:hypothetical protein HJFPF1_10241 [Paramyrothecium foliicola]
MPMEAEFSFKNQFDLYSLKDHFYATSSAASSYYGIHFQGLRYPSGTADDTLFPELDESNIPRNMADLSVLTPGIQVTFNCEIVSVPDTTRLAQEHSPNSNSGNSAIGPRLVADIKVPDCHITGVEIAAGPNDMNFLPLGTVSDYQTRFDWYTCNTTFDYGQANKSKVVEFKADSRKTRHADNRLLMVVTDVRFDERSRTPYDQNSIRVNRTAAALCKPGFTINHYELHSPYSNGSANAVPSTKAYEERPLGFSKTILGVAVYNEINKFSLRKKSASLIMPTPSFFEIMDLEPSGKTLESLLDPEVLVISGTQVFKGIAVQILHEMAMVSGGGTFPGHIFWLEDRLKVAVLSTSMMCVSLILLVIITTSILYTLVPVALPFNPETLASIAVMLASSPYLDQTLARMYGGPEQQYHHDPQAVWFKVSQYRTNDFSILVEPEQELESEQEHDAKKLDSLGKSRRASWWCPVAGRHWYFCLLMGLPIALIVSLEVTQRFSDRNYGVVDIGPFVTVAFATYIPAALALCIAALYSGLEFTASIFAPFITLQQAHDRDICPVTLSFVGKLLPHAAYLAVRSRNYAVITALLGNFISGLLPVVISGLFAAATIPETKQIRISQKDEFSFSGPNVRFMVDQASNLVSTTNFMDLDYTKWTFEDLVFSRLEYLSPSTIDPESGSQIEMVAPAFRAELDCKALPQANRTISTRPPLDEMIQLTTILPAKEWCDLWPVDDGSHLEWVQNYTLPASSNGQGAEYGLPRYFGKAANLDWISVLGFSNVNSQSVTAGFTDNIPDYGCPRLAVTLGSRRFQGERMSSETNKLFNFDFGTLLCYQKIQQAEARVTLRYLSYSIDEKSPPNLNKTTLTYLDNLNGSTRFDFDAGSLLENLGDAYHNSSGSNTLEFSYPNHDLDPGIRALIAGRGASLLEYISGEHNTKQLQSTMNQLYGRPMAQAISLSLRNEIDSQRHDIELINGVLTNNGRQRLHQNVTAKLILQILLGTMAVCAIMTRLLLPLSKVLPHNPCSIAGKASLVAGTSLTSEHISNVWRKEWDGDSGLLLKKIYGNRDYRLGWWKVKGGGKRYCINTVWRRRSER